MKIIQTMWNAITTQNEIALNIVGFFSCFIDTFVNTLKSDVEGELGFVKNNEEFNELINNI